MGDSRLVRRSSKLELPGLDRELSLGAELTRRDILKIAGYGSLAAFIAACGGSTTTTTTGITAKNGNLSLGSYNTDPNSKKGTQAIVDAFTAANGTKVKL